MSGSSTIDRQSSQQTNPWGPQADYLTHGFEQSKGALTSGLSDISKIAQYPTMNSTQKGALGAIAKQGTAFNNSVGGLQSKLLGMTANGPHSVANPALSNLTNAAAAMTNGNAGQGVYKQAMTGGQGGALASANYKDFAAGPDYSKAGSVFGDVSQDQTGRLVSNAGQYVNNDILNAQIDAAGNDVSKGLRTTLGGISAGAAGSGNSNSSRTGTREAYAMRDAGDRMADISATMRGDAYKTGINAALGAEQLRQGSTLDANSQLQQDDAYRQNGMLSATDQVIGNQNQRLGLALDAQGLGLQGKQIGMGALSDAAALKENAANGAQGRFNDNLANLADTYGMGSQGLIDALNSGNALQDDQKAAITDQLTRAGMPLDMVQKYMATVGGNFGQSGYQTQVTEQASPFQQLLGGATSALGAWGSFRGK